MKLFIPNQNLFHKICLDPTKKKLSRRSSLLTYGKLSTFLSLFATHKLALLHGACTHLGLQQRCGHLTRNKYQSNINPNDRLWLKWIIDTGVGKKREIKYYRFKDNHH